MLAVVFAIRKFFQYLTMSNVAVYTDRTINKYLLEKKDATGRQIRWVFILQVFTLEIQGKKGIENVVLDHHYYLPIVHEDYKEDYLPKYMISSGMSTCIGQIGCPLV